MKAFVATIFMFVLGDYAINHGNGTAALFLFAHNFVTSVAHAGSESVFTH